MKIVYYKLIKITINAPGLSKVIIDIMIRHYSLSNSILFIKDCYLPQRFGPCYAIFWHQAKTFLCLLPINKWPDWETK